MQKYINERVENMGKKIGSGATRAVFECKTDNDIVIKISKKGNDENMLEYKIWKKYENSKFANFLCPVIAISKDGKTLIMKRAKKICKNHFTEEEEKKYIEEYENTKKIIIKFCSKITDFRISNFCVYQNRVVMIDFAHFRNEVLLDDNFCNLNYLETL